MNVKSILMIIAFEGFRDEEFLIPKKEFDTNGFLVDVVSTKKGVAKAMFGTTYKIEKTINNVNVKDYDAIVFIGGAGVPTIRKEKKALEIAKEANKKKKIIGAICWAPTILAKAGILKGKKITLWQGFDIEYNTITSKVVEKYGAIFIKKGFEVDRNIVTADGPTHAKEFARNIIKLLNEK